MELYKTGRIRLMKSSPILASLAWPLKKKSLLNSDLIYFWGKNVFLKISLKGNFDGFKLYNYKSNHTHYKYLKNTNYK